MLPFWSQSRPPSKVKKANHRILPSNKMLFLAIIFFHFQLAFSHPEKDCNCAPSTSEATTREPNEFSDRLTIVIAVSAATVLAVIAAAFFFWFCHVPVKMAEYYSADPTIRWTGMLAHGPPTPKDRTTKTAQTTGKLKSEVKAKPIKVAQLEKFKSGTFKAAYWTDKRMKEFATTPGRFQKPKYTEVYEKDVQIVRLAAGQPIPAKLDFKNPKNQENDQRTKAEELKDLSTCWSKVIGCRKDEGPFQINEPPTEDDEFIGTTASIFTDVLTARTGAHSQMSLFTSTMMDLEIISELDDVSKGKKSSTSRSAGSQDKVSKKSGKISKKSDNISKKSDKISKRSDKLSKKSDNISKKSDKISKKSDKLSKKSRISVNRKRSISAKRRVSKTSVHK